jgi:tetratricopeptide (TPR) repeat protein
MRNILTITTALVFYASAVFGQSIEQQFKEASSQNNASRQAKILSEWEAINTKEPAFYIAAFNYYVQQSRRETVFLDRTRKGNGSFVVSDTGTGNPVAHLNASVNYKSDVLQKGFDYITQGIALYPNRLDMRFGKIYMLGEAENFEAFTQEIIAAIAYGYKVGHAWLWKDGKPLDDARPFFLGSLQDYITTLYNTEDNKLLPLMRTVSEAVVRYEPTHVESLSNIALTYLLTGDLDKAIPYLLKAEGAAPKDVVVLNNIAEAYKRKGDKARAKVYYEKVIQYGNREEAQDARGKLKSLD